MSPILEVDCIEMEGEYHPWYQMSDWVWIWFWYFLTVILVWVVLLLTKSGGMRGGVSFFIATIFGLVVALILIPYYRTPTMSSSDENALTSLVVVATLLPVFALIYVAATGEGRNYWNRGMKGFKKDARYVEVEAVCDKDLNCTITDVKSRNQPEARSPIFFS